MGKELPTDIKIYENLDEFEKNLPKTVNILKTPEGSKVYLIGTAHFSLESQDDVSFVIRNVKPDILVLELCKYRLHILNLDEETLLREANQMNQTKSKEIIKQYGFTSGVFYLFLLKSSANITKQLGMAPGGECRRAVAEIDKYSPKCRIMLGDRPINITMERAIRGLTVAERIKLLSYIFFISKQNSQPKITQEDVERLKKEHHGDKKVVDETENVFPSLYRAFVTERDIFLCHSLQFAARPKIKADGVTKPVNVVGVVGIGHSAGIRKNWGTVETERVKELILIPGSGIAGKVVKYGLMSLFAYGMYKSVKPSNKS